MAFDDWPVDLGEYLDQDNEEGVRFDLLEAKQPKYALDYRKRD